MRKSKTVRFNRRVVAVGVGAAVASLLALAPAAVANIAPEVTNARATPSTLPYYGGTVAVSADVTDIEGGFVDFVYVDFTAPSPGSGPALSNGGTEWFGYVEIPPNFSGSPVTWQFTVVARDTELAEGRSQAVQVLVAAGPLFDDPPVVSDPSVVPRDLPSTGGPVKLAVSASDLTGIEETYADVTGPGGAPTRVALVPVGGDRFEGVFTAPPNTGTATAQYAVRMVAIDLVGQPDGVDAGVIRVAGKPSGRLEVRTTALDFGATQVGKRMQRPVVLRNVGAKSTAPVEGVITTSGAPFFVAGAPATGLPFCLRPGETVSFLVEFRPTAAGVRRGTLLVSRADLVQPALSIPLAGTGITRGNAAPALGTPPAGKACR